MESNDTPVQVIEFECLITEIDDLTPKWMSAEGRNFAHGAEAATFRLQTHGPFPHGHLDKLIGRKARVTILD